MSFMFSGCGLFRSEVSRWDLRHAVDLWCLFDGCVVFNSDVSQWNVSGTAYQTRGLFHNCPLFDREFVSGWENDADSLEVFSDGCDDCYGYQDDEVDDDDDE
jgi:Mycoplasma protein of unknown function, DUF285